MITNAVSTYPSSSRYVRGFTLVELMVAITLGILVSIGLVTLFGATSKANRVQDGLAQLQENGRYAINRLNYDLRMQSRQLMNASGMLPSAPGTNGAVGTVLAPQVYVDAIPFPDLAAGGGLKKPPTWTGASIPPWWPLSPRYFMQGYNCSGGCTVPAGVAPADGNTTAGQRVQGADVLLLRYLNTRGWSSLNGEVKTTCNGANLLNVALTPATAAPFNSPASNFQGGDLAMLSYSNGASYIFPVTVAGNVLTPSGPYAASIGGCTSTDSGPEATLYNFTRNFITVTYWLQLTDDQSRPGRLIPALMRQEADMSGVAPAPAELVQGAEQLAFMFGVQAMDGKNRLLTADQVTTSTAVTCPLPPEQYTKFMPGTLEVDGCLWRAVKTVEVHLLLDSVNDMFDLTNGEMAYISTANNNYVSPYVYDGLAAPPTLQAGNIKFGSMMRREFVSLVSVRNFNP